MNKQNLNIIRNKYPIGAYVKLITMKDDFPVPVGSKGKIIEIDDSGNLRIKWENNSSLRLIPGIDDFIVL